MKDFSHLKKNLKKDFSAFPKVKLALLGDTATQFLNQALRGTAYEKQIDLEIYEAEFDQVTQEIVDVESGLYAFRPELIIIFQSSHKLLTTYNKSSAQNQTKLASQRLKEIEDLCSTFSSHLSAKVIYFNYTEIDDSVFGNYANKLESSFLYQVRKLNYELMNYAVKNPDFHICDLSSIQNLTGKSTFFPASIYVNSEMVLSMDVLPLVAARALYLITNLQGKFKKCLILDLDNTLWGGIIGDDGLENIQLGNLGIGKAFTEFQYWIKKLKERGIILAVCSKNTEAVAKEVFDKHPDMVLKLEDIAVFVANWENKVDNIRYVQSVLNISFDSMVFLDDNPFERAMVRETINGITVPELPEDPADYLEFLYTLNLFETSSLSEEDKARTKLYQLEAERASFFKSYTNEEEFLKDLQMEARIEAFTKFNIPRVAQLSQRSNQFNLRTVRYSDSDIAALSQSKDYFPFSLSLKDKFGDNGLINVVILKKETSETLFIESWFMSCRVLKRGMENFVLNALLDFAKENKFKTLKGEYIPTPKNALVINHYENLGFSKSENFWTMEVETYTPKLTHIKLKN